MPALPKPDKHGRFSALQYARISLARDLIRDRKGVGLSQQRLAARHYVQVTDGDFRRASGALPEAVRNRVQQAHETPCNGRQENTATPGFPEDFQGVARVYTRSGGGGGNRTRVPRHFHACFYVCSRIICAFAALAPNRRGEKAASRQRFLIPGVADSDLRRSGIVAGSRTSPAKVLSRGNLSLGGHCEIRLGN